MKRNIKLICLILTLSLLLFSCKQSKKIEEKNIQSEDTTTDQKFNSKIDSSNLDRGKIYGYSVMKSMSQIEINKAISRSQIMIADQINPQDFEYSKTDDSLTIKRNQSLMLSGVKRKEIRELNNGASLFIMEYDGKVEKLGKETIFYDNQKIIGADINRGISDLIKNTIILVLKENNIQNDNIVGKISISDLTINETKESDFEIEASIGIEIKE